MPTALARIEKAAWVLFLVVIASRALSPNVIGILNNDSIHYLERAANPNAYGFVYQGFRQAGYPLFLAAVDFVADRTPYDLFFLTAVVQRALMLGVLAYVAHLLRWWAAPALVFLSMPTLVTTTNLLLTEALSLPLAVLLACLLVHASGLARPTVDLKGQLWLMALAGALVVVLALIKFQYAAMLLPFAGLIITLVHGKAMPRRSGVMILVLPTLLIACLGVVQSIENRRETGEFTPVSESARVAWYSAYKSVFFGLTTIPSELEHFYDNGDLYRFLHELERDEPDYLVRREVIEARIDALFAAAGVGHREMQVQAFLFFLQLGPSDDLEAMVRFIRQRPTHEAEALNERNYFAAAHGVGALYETFNSGQVPDSLSTSSLALAIGLDDYRHVRLWVLPVSILILVAGALLRATRWLALGTLVMVTAVAAAHAFYYTSNSRYTLPSAAFATVITTLVLANVLNHLVLRLQTKSAS